MHVHMHANTVGMLVLLERGQMSLAMPGNICINTYMYMHAQVAVINREIWE